MQPEPITPAKAYWKQRHAIHAASGRLRALADAVGSQNELHLYQWAQLYAFALEFQPDLIVELGREKGNSTCLFTEAAHQMAGSHACRVVSICWSQMFRKETIPALRSQGLVDDEWLAPLESLETDICTVDYPSLFSQAERILVFWDAHGFEVAETVLGQVLPAIQEKRHFLLMHDLSDQRYMSRELAAYGNNGIWKGDSHGQARMILGHVNAAVSQAISIVDFCSRNQLVLESADHSIHQELVADGRSDLLAQLLGEDLFSVQGHWFYLTLNGHEGPLSFPATP